MKNNVFTVPASQDEEVDNKTSPFEIVLYCLSALVFIFSAVSYIIFTI